MEALSGHDNYIHGIFGTTVTLKLAIAVTIRTHRTVCLHSFRQCDWSALVPVPAEFESAFKHVSERMSSFER